MNPLKKFLLFTIALQLLANWTMAGFSQIQQGGQLQSRSDETAQAEETQLKSNSIRRDSLGAVERVYSDGNVMLAGQPAEVDFQKLQKAGVKRVVNLYRPQGMSFEESKVCQALAMEYQHVPFDDEKQLNDSVFNTVRIALLESDTKPVLIHCNSNDRASAVWAAYRTLDQGVNLETAIAEAKAMGLKTAGYERKLRGYVAHMLNPVSQPVPMTQPGGS